MAEGRGELEVYNTWFVAADLDRDGVLSGLEAVQFFQRSGLPQNPTLFKVWQYVAADRPALSRQEFYTAMKLVSLAQLNGGVLDDQQALRLVNGLGGAVPLPRMSGMVIPRGIELPPHLLPAGAPGAAGPVAAPTAAAPGGLSPARPAPPPAAFPPASPVPAAAGWPPLSGEQAAAFTTAFGQLDTDRDGFVQGTDCFGAFMQSGLPKQALKQIWDLVAGDEPRLNRHQWVQALYLIDCSKRGMAIPVALPPGPFPPVAGTVSIGAMGAGAPADIYSASLSIPDMVPRAVYQPQPQAPLPFASQVPSLPAGRVAALDAADQLRLEGEREAALAAEAEQRKAEEERASAASKKDFFTRSLADMRLVQSKVTRAVVEAQQRCEMEQAAADQMEADYDRAYAEFSRKHAESAPLVAQLKQTQDEKAALSAKLESLRAMVAQLEDFDPEWENREKGECEALNLEIASLTVKKEQLQRSSEATARKRDALVAQIAALKEAAVGVDGELGSLQEEVDKVAAEGAKEKEAVVALLTRLAPLYNKLYAAAKAALVPLPAEAVATMKREASPFKYDELLAVAAGDWGAFKDEGFKIVSALPVDTRLTTFAAPSTAALEKEEEEAAAAAAAAADASTAADPEQPAAAAALGKASSNAEAEAVSAAAEAGVLASAIAEALAGAPAKVPKSAGAAAAAGADPKAVAESAEQAAAAEGEGEAAEAPAAEPSAVPFEVSFGNGAEVAEVDVAVAVAGVDAFAAFDAAATGGEAPATAVAAEPAAEAPPAVAVVKQSSGAFGSSQALASESPKVDPTAPAPAEKGDEAVEGGKAAPDAAAAPEQEKEAEAAPAPSDSWTAF